VDVPDGQSWDIAQVASGYGELFLLMMGIGLGCGAVALIVSPVLKRMMRSA
jgi:POT family proton-dependent oligopeptide transporter